jgi:hypothetical protein
MAEFYAREVLTHQPFAGRYRGHSWRVADDVMYIKVEALQDDAISNVDCLVRLTAT